MPSQGRYWLLTMPHHTFTPYLPRACAWLKGQLELGEGGFLHWQVVVAFAKKIRLAGVKEVFGEQCHAEVTRSAAAEDYVHKDDTAIVETRFELGAKAMKRQNADDWEQVWQNAKDGNMADIPADVRIRSYHTLKRIRKDYEEAPFREGVVVNVR